MFFFNDTATTEIYTLSLHDALPISQCSLSQLAGRDRPAGWLGDGSGRSSAGVHGLFGASTLPRKDWKSTRLNSSHANISYAVFCLKKQITPFRCLQSCFA